MADDTRSVRLGNRGMFAAFIATMGFLVLLDVGIAGQRDVQWWASAGQWVGGIGSIAAAGAALWIAHRGWVLAATDARENEARKFAMWVSTDGSETPVVTYVNTTSLPVYDVVARTRISHFSHTFRLGTMSPTDRTGSVLPIVGARLADSVRIAVFERIGQEAYYQKEETGEYGYKVHEDNEITRAALSESFDVIRKIELSVTFRQGKHRWRADHDGALTQP